ncbi:MAG TPA: glycolate oxidase subunit GlcF, partial [Burkholderiales bacterium]|nr:glycolate oxidase subunit GlcF [Burkholderiales bacterium]
IKEMLEGHEATSRTRLHLDRCLTCRSCETTCPSGVQYGRLIDIGRQEIEKRSVRPWHERLFRRTLLSILPHPRRYAYALGLARIARPFLPAFLKDRIPGKEPVSSLPSSSHSRKMLLLEGCVQPASAPNTNAAAARVLDRLGISVLSVPGCCGALHQHLSEAEGARAIMRRNIDAWWPMIEAGIEAVVISASGCSQMVKEYGHLLRGDPAYAEKADRVSGLARDLSEVIRDEDLESFGSAGKGMRIAYHSSCTLQHGQKLGGTVEEILRRCGYTLTIVADGHLCCGAAGTYVLTQPALSRKLLENKLVTLEEEGPEMIATANIGCQLHLASRSRVPVRHWVELLDLA